MTTGAVGVTLTLCAQEERYKTPARSTPCTAKGSQEAVAFAPPNREVGGGYAGSLEQHHPAPSDLKNLPFLLPGEIRCPHLHQAQTDTSSRSGTGPSPLRWVSFPLARLRDLPRADNA